MKNTLVIYFHRFTYPMRKTTEDLTYCFEKNKESRFYFVNAAFGVPFYLRFIPFDLVIYQATFIGRLRWTEMSYEQWTHTYRGFKNLKGTKALLPQDEFLCSDRICRFIKEFGIHHVFSVSPKSEWEKIYPNIDPSQVSFYQVLTGYLDQKVVSQVEQLSKEIPERDIDISYRAWHAEPWLGRHGLLKTQIAQAVKEKAKEHSLKVDISTDDSKTFLGMDWYRFLLRSKWTIGVEGGSSILDTDGSLKQKVGLYLKQHPQASFEEVEQACFPNQDGKLQLYALSPRHLEACMTKTCQVLIEGEYNGILKPSLHYLELKKDFSNLDSVLKALQNDSLRKQIAERAYQDIVLNESNYYSHFAQMVLEKSWPSSTPEANKNLTHLWYRFNQIREYVLWTWIRTETTLWKIAKKMLPFTLIKTLRGIKQKMFPA